MTFFVRPGLTQAVACTNFLASVASTVKPVVSKAHWQGKMLNVDFVVDGGLPTEDSVLDFISSSLSDIREACLIQSIQKNVGIHGWTVPLVILFIVPVIVNDPNIIWKVPMQSLAPIFSLFKYYLFEIRRVHCTSSFETL